MLFPVKRCKKGIKNRRFTEFDAFAENAYEKKPYCSEECLLRKGLLKVVRDGHAN